MLPRSYSNAVVALLLRDPFYAHVLSEFVPVITTSIPTAAVRADTPPRLLINPDFFDSLEPKHRLGVLKHEVLHVLMEHFARGANKEHTRFNLASDVAVNELIPGDELPPGAATVESVEPSYKFFSGGKSLPRKAAAEVYYELFDVFPKIYVACGASGESDGGQGGGQQGDQGDKQDNNSGYGLDGVKARPIDEHIYESDPARAELAKEIIKDIVQRAVKTCGRVPGELESVITALTKPVINWRRVLMRFLSGRGKMLPQSTYLRESKRFDGFPGRRKSVGMEALVAIDTSGSMSDEQLSEVLSNLLAIKKISGTKIWVTWGDMKKVGGPLPIERVGKKIKLGGRGGTDLCWPFKLADEMRLPVLVYFTDGYGPAPDTAHQRTLWVLTRDGRQPAQFGDVVVMQK